LPISTVVFTSSVGRPDARDAGSFEDLVSFMVVQTPQVLVELSVAESESGLSVATNSVVGAFPHGFVDLLLDMYVSTLARLSADADAWTAPLSVSLPEPVVAKLASVNDTSAPTTSATLPGLFVDALRGNADRPCVIDAE